MPIVIFIHDFSAITNVSYQVSSSLTEARTMRFDAPRAYPAQPLRCAIKTTSLNFHAIAPAAFLYAFVSAPLRALVRLDGLHCWRSLVFILRGVRAGLDTFLVVVNLHLVLSAVRFVYSDMGRVLGVEGRVRHLNILAFFYFVVHTAPVG